MPKQINLGELSAYNAMMGNERERTALARADEYFQTKHLDADLGRRAVSGGIITLSAQACKFILQIGQTVVLARLLTPVDFGLIGMVTAITGFVVMFKDLGLAESTVQRDEINHSQITMLFWINVVISIGIMLLLAALAPAVAWFYNEPRLVSVTIALSLSFIVGGLTVQHQALLRRQMRFLSLAVIDISSLVTGVIVAVVLASRGAGYWALVAMQLAVSLSTAVGVWVLCGWRPGLPALNAKVRSMVAFGGRLTGFNVLNYFARNLDNMLIGKFWGATQLGIYAVAYKMLLLPIQQINVPMTNVAVPALSRLQTDKERYRRYYCKAMNIMAYVTTPLIVTMAVLSDEIIIVVLSEKWLAVSPIFKILAIAALGQPIASAIGWVYISLGQTDRMLKWAYISVPLYILSFIVGLPWGAIGVAIAYTVCVHALRIPLFLFAFRYAPVKIHDLIRATWRPHFISIVMAVIMFNVRRFVSHLDPMLIVINVSIAGFLSLAAIVLLWPKARTEISSIIDSLRDIKGNSYRLEK